MKLQDFFKNWQTKKEVQSSYNQIVQEYQTTIHEIYSHKVERKAEQELAEKLPKCVKNFRAYSLENPEILPINSKVEQELAEATNNYNESIKQLLKKLSPKETEILRKIAKRV